MPKRSLPKKAAAASTADPLIESALRLMEAAPWPEVTLEAIAKAARQPLSKVYERFPDKNSLARALVGYFTQRTEQSVGKIEMQQPAKDRLFEVMMARFDQLQTNRLAVINILKAAKRDPALAQALAAAQRQAMGHMLALAGLDDTGASGKLKIAGLSIIYMLAGLRWLRDPSPDMAKTMALLDRLLGRANKFAEIILR